MRFSLGELALLALLDKASLCFAPSRYLLSPNLANADFTSLLSPTTFENLTILIIDKLYPDRQCISSSQ